MRQPQTEEVEVVVVPSDAEPDWIDWAVGP